MSTAKLEIMNKDLTVALDIGHAKSASASRNERVEKYNRLLEIEEKLSNYAQYFWK
jgi:enolase